MTDDAAHLVGREPDERLLSEDLDKLPAAVGRPEAIPTSRARAPIVGIGATLTGVSLVVGALLIVVGAILGIADGFDLSAVLALVVGAVLVSTHWGWVHVAELTAQRIEGRTDAAIVDRRRQWLATVSPYTHYEVSTSVQDDGSIRIARVRYRPTAAGPGSFTFVREPQSAETLAADEPAAVVSERAEAMRHQAATDTERERERYQAAADAHAAALLERDDSEQRRAAQRAESEALSRQLNENLRDPPLVE